MSSCISTIAIRVISDERILESGDFAETVLRDANEAYEGKTQIRAKGPTLDYKEAGR